MIKWCDSEVELREENSTHEVVSINLLSRQAPLTKPNRIVGSGNGAWRFFEYTDSINLSSF